MAVVCSLDVMSLIGRCKNRGYPEKKEFLPGLYHILPVTQKPPAKLWEAFVARVLRF
jgi:hypothetical protein